MIGDDDDEPHDYASPRCFMQEIDPAYFGLTPPSPPMQRVFAWRKEQRERLRELAPRAQDFTNKRAYKNQPLSEADKATNRRKSSVRSKVEHPFLTLKRLWGFAKVRYRGLAKNANRAFALLAMINISKWGRPLTGKVCPA